MLNHRFQVPIPAPAIEAEIFSAGKIVADSAVGIEKNFDSHNQSEAPKLLNQPIYIAYKTSSGIKKPTKGVGFHLEKNL